MHKGWIVLAACCGFMMLQVPSRAEAATADAAAEASENQEVIHRGTDFYMQIEVPETQYEEPEIIETPEATQSHESTESPESTENPGSTESPKSTESLGSTESPESTESPGNTGTGGSGGTGGGRNSGGRGDDGDSSDIYTSSDEQSITYYNLPLGTDTDPWAFEDPDNRNHNSDFPKTGDYGPDKTVLFELALLFGAGYLLCDYYEKRLKESSL
jgi:hypothetical protein